MHAASRDAFGPHLRAFTRLQRRARVTRMRTVFTLFVVSCATCLADCSHARKFELRGQIVAVDRGRQELTIKHEDIRGFMPGMTMPFKVRDARLLEGREAGDLVKATLVVENANAYLSSVERIGHAELDEPPPPPRVDVLEPGQPVPDVPLTDEAGMSRMLSDRRGRIVAVTFTYTRCPMPDFCPRMDQQFKQVQGEILADPAMRDRIALLSVSFDPTFDTPQVLAAHAQQVGADPRVWHFVTGAREAIGAFASAFGISIIRDGPSAAGITHNLRTAVVASDGTLLTIFNGSDWTPADLMHALRQAH
jgi:protein SCO1/2